MTPYSMMEQQQQQQRFMPQDQIPNPNSLYKVTLCQHFKKGGYCDMGADCNFAHGENELRGNYKTVLCKMVTTQIKCFIKNGWGVLFVGQVFILN